MSDTQVTVELTFDGNISTDSTLIFTVGPAAIAGYDGAALTAQVPVSASTETPTVTDPQPPQQPDITNSRLAFESTTPAGYTRVTLRNTGTVWGVPTQYTTDSDVGTVAYMLLATLKGCSFADAEVSRQSKVHIKTQALGSLSNFASETVCGKTSRTWTTSWNGVRITHLRFFDESSTPNIKEAVYNDATGQIEIPGDSVQTPTPTNTAPTFTAGSTTTRTVAENTVANVNVGSAVAATDANNDTLTYTLGGTDANVFSIESTTGQLKTRAALDYETKRTYTVTITVSDGNGGSDSITVTITVTNVVENRAPVFTDGVSTTRSVTENTAARQNIGRTISATDPNGDTLRYNLSGTEAASFRIDGTTGQLRTWAALDYETKSSYTVTVTVSDGDLTDTITVTVNITDINELPTDAGICQVGDILAPGESCTYPDTDATFSVLDNGHARWNIPGLPSWLAWANQVSIGGSLSFTATINDEDYHFVAEEGTNDSWEIKEIGEDRPEQPETPETPEQPDDVGGTPTVTASTTAPLTETTLDESIVTLTLSGATYHTNWNFVSRSVEVSGITGVRQYHVDRVSDTEVTVELEFNGNINADSTLTFTVGADAIANYNGPAFTAQVPVSANTESLIATTAAPLTEVTLNGSIITLTLGGAAYHTNWNFVSRSVEVSGITGVRQYHVDRVSDTEVTVELEFNGNINADSTLTFTVGHSKLQDHRTSTGIRTQNR